MAISGKADCTMPFKPSVSFAWTSSHAQPSPLSTTAWHSHLPQTGQVSPASTTCGCSVAQALIASSSFSNSMSSPGSAWPRHSKVQVSTWISSPLLNCHTSITPNTITGFRSFEAVGLSCDRLLVSFHQKLLIILWLIFPPPPWKTTGGFFPTAV